MARTGKWVWERGVVIPQTSVSQQHGVKCEGMGTLVFQSVNHGGGQWVYTFLFKGTLNGVNWEQIYGVSQHNAFQPESGGTDEGIWAFPVGAFEEIAVELTVTSGSPEVEILYGISAAPFGYPLYYVGPQ